MAEKIIAEYELQNTKFKQQIKEIVDRLDDIEKKGKKAGDENKKSFNGAEDSVKKFGKSVKDSESQLQSIKGMVTKFAGALGIAFGVQEVLQFTKATIDAASNLQETFSKTQQLFGANTDQIIEWSKTTANSLGQSQQQALDAASTFAIFGRSAGLTGEDLVKFSTDFTALASDLASFNNTSPEEAIQAIGAALRGENEPIRRYGVLLDEASLKQAALKANIISSTKEALTPQQKVLAAQLEIYRQTIPAQGDFLKTSEGLANQQRILAANFANLQAEIGQALLPVMLDFVKTLNSLVKGDIPGMIDGLGKLNDKLNPLGLGIGGLVNMVENMSEAFKLVSDGDFSGAIEKLGSAFLDLNGAINPLIGVLRYFKSELFGISTELSEAEQLEQRLEARQNTFNNAVLEGGEALEIFRKRAKEVLGATDEQFNKYVETQRKRLAQSQMNNEEDKKSISLFKQMQQEVAAITDRITQQLLTGGVVSQKDIDRLGFLNGKLEGVKNRLDEIKKRNEPIKIDFEGLDEGNKKVNKFLEVLLPAYRTAQAEADRFNESFEKRNQKQMAADAKFLEQEKNRNEQARALLDSFNLVYEGAGEFRVKTDADKFEEQKRQLDIFLKEGRISYEEYYAAIAQLDQETREQQMAGAAAVIQEVGNQVANIAGLVSQFQQLQRDEITRTYDTQINAIQNSELSEKEKAKKIEALRKQQAKEEYELQLKQFKINKAIAIVQAVINTAQAVTSQLGAGPVVGFVLAALAAATGAAQIGLIAAQQPPPPAFAEGTDFVQRGKNKAGVDTIPAYLNEGEAVIPTDKNKAYPGLAKAWIAGNLDDYIVRNFVAPKLIDMERKAEKRMADSFAASLKGDGFDDARLLMATTEGNMYLKTIAKEMKTKQKKRTAW